MISSSSKGWLVILVAISLLGIPLGCADEDEPEPDASDTIGDQTPDIPDTTPATGLSCSHDVGCTDYVGSMWTEAVAQGNCAEIPNSTFSTSSCPTANLVGSCSTNPGGAGEFITRYYSPMFMPATAQSVCENSGGTWIP